MGNVRNYLSSTWLAPCLLLCFSAAWANTQSTSHAQAVQQRIDGMKMMKTNVKLAADMVRGRAPFDAIALQKAAEEIADNAPEIPSLFPPGSLIEPSNALETVWSKPEKFEQLAKDLQSEANALAASAQQNDPRLSKKRFREMGRVCAGCHKEFRKRTSTD